MAEGGPDPVAEARKETRDYVWNYWEFHADQRLRTFHFFILFVTVLVAGILTFLKDARSPWLAAFGAFLIPVLCYVFWRLDCRNRALIDHAESILRSIEKSIPEETVPAAQRLFMTADLTADDLKAARRQNAMWMPARWWHAPLSFTSSFCWIFSLFALLGLVLGLVAILAPP